MTQEQREKLYVILGKIEGLTYGVENCDVNEGFWEVARFLEQLLKEDAKDGK